MTPLFRWALLCSLATASAHAQSFTRITIRSAASADPRSRRLEVRPDGELIAHAVLVLDLISYAYDVPSNPSPRLRAVPDWISGERFDLRAQAPPGSITPTARDRDTQHQVQQMIRRLLADRFALVMQVDQQSLPVYALRVSRGGPHLQPSTVARNSCILDTAPRGCHTFRIGFGHPLVANAASMDDLARYLENWTDRPVVNRTDLSGLYTMRTEGWRPMALPPPPPGGNGHVDFSSLPTLATVLARLGLELHGEQQLVPVYTIQHLDHPRIDPSPTR